jgi:hypothetical protein
MIGEAAYENKPGGRRLGTIVGQRTTPNAEGVPVEQWEIRSSRGIKFFIPKAEVRTASEPEPEPQPEPGSEPLGPGESTGPAIAAPAEAPGEAPIYVAAPQPAGGLQERIEKEVARRRSVLPVVVTLLGVAVCIVTGVLCALGFARKLSEQYEAIVGAIPALIGFLIILIGTGLVQEQSKKLALLRRKLADRAGRAEEAQKR